MYHDSLYYLSPDAHLVCLNAKDGKPRWTVAVADSDKGYWSTAAPVIVGNHVIVGIGGDSDNIQGFLKSMDADTGALQWRWDATPPDGTPKATTGGMTWIPGTYDPELNLLYWGTGNPTPVLNGDVRPGDDLYTCTIVALNPDTGKLVWAFQPSPHDTHDWDAVEIPVLVDGMFRGQAAQDAHAGFAQRLFLRARSHQWRKPLDRALWSDELGARHRQKGPAAFPIPLKTRRQTAAWSRRTKVDSPTTVRPASTQNRALYRQQKYQLRSLFHQARGRRLGLGRCGLRHLGKRRSGCHRLPDRQGPVDPSNWF